MVRPILSSLLRNGAGAVLVAVQIAITLAIIVNAVFMVSQRIAQVSRPTGLDEHNMFAMWISIFGKDPDFHGMVRDDMAMLQRMPGVVAATPTPQVPLSGSGNSSRYFAEPNEKGEAAPVAIYDTDEHGVAALGTRLSEGKPFEAQNIEYRRSDVPAPPASGQLIVSKRFAKKLFPKDDHFLGKVIYDNQSKPHTVTGVIEYMQGSWVGWDDLENVMLRPVVNNGPAVQYLIRAEPGQIDRVMAEVESALKKARKDRVVGELKKVSAMKERSYSSDTLIVVILGITSGLVVIFSALGIFGLATFNVNTRTKQIGTRRAVGARRGDIVRYFLVENWLITTVGVFAGCALALGGGYWLSSQYGLDRLDLYYLIGGVLGLWGIGQLAALHPSLRASKVSPATATRNV